MGTCVTFFTLVLWKIGNTMEMYLSVLTAQRFSVDAQSVDQSSIFVDQNRQYSSAASSVLPAKKENIKLKDVSANTNA